MSMPDPLKSQSPLIVYVDIKSPYAYLAIEPTRALERELGMRFDWRPFVLDIPSYLGSARLGDNDEVVQAQRSDAQWASVKYAYFDCRRYARLQGRTIRGTVKIWDTHLVSAAMLWLREHHSDLLAAFMDRVLPPFWVRELDVENTDVVVGLLDELGLSGQAFAAWLTQGGMQETIRFQEEAFAHGVYGVPTYLVDGERFFGREHLPRVRWLLAGSKGSPPDIAYDLSEALPPPARLPHSILVGLDNSYDCALALPRLVQLLSDFQRSVTQRGETCSIRWSYRPSMPDGAVSSTENSARGDAHQRLRRENHRLDTQRYAPSGWNDDASLNIERYALQIQDDVPAALPGIQQAGIAVMLDDELFIGRQHLPLLASRLGLPSIDDKPGTRP